MGESVLVTGLKNHPNYDTAKSVLYSILNQNIDSKGLKELYGSAAGIIEKDLTSMLESNEWKVGTIREHQLKARKIIKIAYNKLNKNEFYHKNQIALGNREEPKLPLIKNLKEFYNSNSSAIQEIYRQVTNINLEKPLNDSNLSKYLFRADGLSFACHYDRVGSVVYQITKDPFLAAIAAGHDGFEDLFSKVKKEKNQRYRLQHEQQFFDRFYAPEMHERIRKLTNIYHTILNFVNESLERKGKAFSYYHMMKELNHQERNNNNSKYIRKSIREMREIFEIVLNKSATNLFPLTKKMTYGMYIKKMNESNVFIVKFPDLLDNAQFYDMGDYFKINNMNKRTNAVNQAKSVKDAILQTKQIEKSKNNGNKKNRTKAEEKEMFLEKIFFNMIPEVEERTLVDAEHLIIRDLLESQSVPGFTQQARNNFIKLLYVFYDHTNH